MVLDLDETLVHSERRFAADADIVLNIDMSKIPCQPMIQKIYVQKRPFCDEFLRALSPLYEIVMFTASMERYASPLFARLDPKGNLIDTSLYRQHCTLLEG